MFIDWTKEIDAYLNAHWDFKTHAYKRLALTGFLNALTKAYEKAEGRANWKELTRDAALLADEAGYNCAMSDMQEDWFAALEIFKNEFVVCEF
jgi:hypothetical protein